MGFGKVTEANTTVKSALENFIRESLPDYGASGRRDCTFQPFRSLVAEAETLPGLDYRRLDAALTKMEASLEEMKLDRELKETRISEIKNRLNQAGVPSAEKDDLNSELHALTSEVNDLRIANSQLQDRYNTRIGMAFGSSASKPEIDTFLYMVERIVKELRKEARMDEVIELKASHAEEDANQSYVVSVIRRKKAKKFTGRKRAISSWRSEGENEDDEFFTSETNGPIGATLVSTK